MPEAIYTQRWKITKNVSFNIASDVSYVFFLSGQKFIRNAPNSQFGEFFKSWRWRSNSVTRQVNSNQQNSKAIFWVIFKHCEYVLSPKIPTLLTSWLSLLKWVVLRTKRTMVFLHILENHLVAASSRIFASSCLSRNAVVEPPLQ